MKFKMNPGSEEAIKKGCTCPVLDNSHGQGFYGRKGVFVINTDCKLHKDKVKKKKVK